MISVCKKAQKSYQMHFSAAKKSRKRSGVQEEQCIYSSQLKGIDAKC